MAAWHIVGPKLLVVEGTDDLLLFGSLACHMGLKDLQIKGLMSREESEHLAWAVQRLLNEIALPKPSGASDTLVPLRAACLLALEGLGISPIQIDPLEGKDALSKRLEALRVSSDFRSRVASLGIVRDADKYPDRAFESVRDALKNAGLPYPDRPDEQAPGPPKVRILIVPGAESEGTIETLCLESVQGRAEMRCVAAYIDCVRKAQVPIGNPTKAAVAAFLAVQKSPFLRTGRAAEAHIWPFESPVFAPIKEFLRSL